MQNITNVSIDPEKEEENLGYVSGYSESEEENKGSYPLEDIGSDGKSPERSGTSVDEERKTHDRLIYGLTDSPPLQITIICGFQVSVMVIVWCYMSLWTLFKSYRDDGRMIMKDSLFDGP